MTPWQCPSCLTWLAPHVGEHRCDPPSGAVPAVVTPITPSGSTSTGGGAGGAGPLVVTLHSNLRVSGRELAKVVQTKTLERARRNGPGRAA
jgi:hypothetical protein